jgi:hypothetical protein
LYIGSDPTYTATESGSYTVNVTNVSGCSNTSPPLAVTLISSQLPLVTKFNKVYPNPSTATIQIETHIEFESSSIKFLDSFGSEVQVPLIMEGKNIEADIRSLAVGIYFLIIRQEGFHINKKITVAK